MEYKINLPIELINKILIMRPTHPIADIINDQYNFYIEYIDNNTTISFKEFELVLKDLFIKYNIKKVKNTRNDIMCNGCYEIIVEDNNYYCNSCVINCEKCF